MFRITDLDPRKLKDWQVAEEAEKHMKTIFQLAEDAGIEGDELIPMGHHIGKVDFLKVLNRLEGRPEWKIHRCDSDHPHPARGGEEHDRHGSRAGTGQTGEEGDRRDPAAVGRPHLQHQGQRCRRRAFPVHSADPLFPGAHRRHRLRGKRPQPGDGRSDLADAT